jgi:myo-inositol-1(or 4)-monophosphatase
MSAPLQHNEAAFALEAVQAAGEEIARLRDSPTLERDRKAHGELVTSADLASDRVLRGRLAAARPGDQLLSEEGERSTIDWEGRVWIADPIDGTVNYVHRSRQVAISLALAVDRCVEVGVVHAPFRAETYLAVRGGGAWARGEGAWRQLRIGPAPELSAALVGTGFPHDRSDLDPLLRRLKAVLTTCRDVRRLGSPCLDICRIATGQLDAYFETVFPWDAAAAVLVAREAGARAGAFAPTRGLWPAPLDGENLLVTSPALFQPFVDLLMSA